MRLLLMAKLLTGAVFIVLSCLSPYVQSCNVTLGASASSQEAANVFLDFADNSSFTSLCLRDGITVSLVSIGDVRLHGSKSITALDQSQPSLELFGTSLWSTEGIVMSGVDVYYGGSDDALVFRLLGSASSLVAESVQLISMGSGAAPCLLLNGTALLSLAGGMSLGCTISILPPTSTVSLYVLSDFSFVLPSTVVAVSVSIEAPTSLTSVNFRASSTIFSAVDSMFTAEKSLSPSVLPGAVAFIFKTATKNTSAEAPSLEDTTRYSVTGVFNDCTFVDYKLPFGGVVSVLEGSAAKANVYSSFICDALALVRLEFTNTFLTNVSTVIEEENTAATEGEGEGEASGDHAQPFLSPFLLKTECTNGLADVAVSMMTVTAEAVSMTGNNTQSCGILCLVCEGDHSCYKASISIAFSKFSYVYSSGYGGFALVGGAGPQYNLRDASIISSDNLFRNVSGLYSGALTITSFGAFGVAYNASVLVQTSLFAYCVTREGGGAGVFFMNVDGQDGFQHASIVAEDSEFFGGYASDGGGAVSFFIDGDGSYDFSSLILRRCTFMFNNGTYGGAVSVFSLMGDGFSNATIVLESCVFHGSNGGVTAGGVVLYAAGINAVSNLTAIISNCVFTENMGGAACGGAISMIMKGITDASFNFIAENSTFRGNVATGNGGGALCCVTAGVTEGAVEGALVIRDCVFEDNIAFSFGGDNGGGAVAMSGLPVDVFITSSTFFRNVIHGGLGGGCVFVSPFVDNAVGSKDITVENCTFSSCEAVLGEGEFGGLGGALAAGAGNLFVSSCMFTNSFAGELRAGASHIQSLSRNVVEKMQITNCSFTNALSAPSSSETSISDINAAVLANAKLVDSTQTDFVDDVLPLSSSAGPRPILLASFSPVIEGAFPPVFASSGHNGKDTIVGFNGSSSNGFFRDLSSTSEGAAYASNAAICPRGHSLRATYQTGPYFNAQLRTHCVPGFPVGAPDSCFNITRLVTVSCQPCDMESFSTIAGTFERPLSQCLSCQRGAICPGGSTLRVNHGYYMNPSLLDFLSSFVNSSVTPGQQQNTVGNDGEGEELWPTTILSRSIDGDYLRFFLVSCPDGYCCDTSLHSNGCPVVISGETVNDGACQGNRIGPICGLCPQNYSYALGTTLCLSSPACDEAAWKWPFIIVILILAAVAYASYLTFVESSASSAAFKTITSFFNLVSLVYVPAALNDEDRSILAAMKDVAMSVVNLHFSSTPVVSKSNASSIDVTSVETPPLLSLCLSNSSGPVAAILLHMAIPLVLFVSIGIVAAVRELFWALRASIRQTETAKKPPKPRTPLSQKRLTRVNEWNVPLNDLASDTEASPRPIAREKKERKGRTEQERIRHLQLYSTAFYSAAVLSYTTLLSTSLRMMQCVELLGKSGNIEVVSLYAGSVACWTQQGGTLVLGLVVLVVLLGFPFCLLGLQVRRIIAERQSKGPSRDGVSLSLTSTEMKDNNEQMPRSPNTRVLSALVNAKIEAPYRKRLFWWEGVMMLRRTVFSLIAVFITEPLIRAFTIACLCLASLLSHSLITPFSSRLDNAAETMALCILTLVALLGIVSGYERSALVRSTTLRSGIAAQVDSAALVLVAVFILYTLFVLLRIGIDGVRKVYRRVRAKKGKRFDGQKQEAYRSSDERQLLSVSSSQ